MFLGVGADLAHCAPWQIHLYTHASIGPWCDPLPPPPPPSPSLTPPTPPPSAGLSPTERVLAISRLPSCLEANSGFHQTNKGHLGPTTTMARLCSQSITGSNAIPIMSPNGFFVCSRVIYMQCGTNCRLIFPLRADYERVIIYPRPYRAVFVF